MKPLLGRCVQRAELAIQQHELVDCGPTRDLSSSHSTHAIADNEYVRRKIVAEAVFVVGPPASRIRDRCHLDHQLRLILHRPVSSSVCFIETICCAPSLCHVTAGCCSSSTQPESSGKSHSQWAYNSSAGRVQTPVAHFDAGCPAFPCRDPQESPETKR